jgi:molybdopterin converting factor small subunit
LFARARELAGSSEVQIALSEPATVGALRTALSQQHPALAALAPVLLVAVGNDYARDADPLPRDRPIACFPPVSGG